MSKLISVIIPVYNHANIFKKSLESLYRQTYKNLEIIIVNDGSTDDFDMVIKEITTNCHSERGLKADEESLSVGQLIETEISHPLRRGFEMTGSGDIKVINQTNQGAPVARNRGFKEAKGEYVIFWDADTIAQPEMLAKMAEVLEKNSVASYVYCDFCFGRKLMRGREFDGDILKKQNYIDTTSLLRARDFSGFDESLKRFQDWDLWLTMLEKNTTGVYIPENLFTKVLKGRHGMSSWLPSFMYKLPWKTKRVKEYEAAREIIFKKHNIWT